jgi:DNA-binding NarL/FixJ family response regulator
MIRTSGALEALTYDRMFASALVSSGSRGEQSSVMQLLRSSVTPETAASMTEAAANLDIADRLAAIAAPALVLHSVQSITVPLTEGRLLASMLPNARFVQLDSANQVLLASEPAWQSFMNEVGAFLKGTDAPNAAQAPIDGLSDRESQVLRRVAEGATDRQIAHELEISVRTVGNHINKFLKKTQSASRAQAAVWAAKKGFL